MQLITGGFGFIGAHTTRALLNLNQECVLVYRRAHPVPEFLKDEIGARVFLEQVDVTDTRSFLEIGQKYKVTGILHLAGSFASGETGFFEDIRASMTGLANVLQAAHQWKVRRTLVASSLVVYNGITQVPWREDSPVTCTASFPIEAFKKAGEIITSQCSHDTGMECITIRIGGIYGPLYDTNSGTRGSLAGRLVHAAIKRAQPNLENIRGSIHSEDGIDWCYALDCGRAIARLMMTAELHYPIYNIASGQLTRNRDLVEAVKRILPDFQVELPAGHAQDGSGLAICQDITRLRTDTGYEPQFDARTGIADYIAWLRAGNAL